MSKIPKFSAPSDATAEVKGQTLLNELKSNHWFWNNGDPHRPEAREDPQLPTGMVDPSCFMNFNTGEYRDFLAELERDGIELNRGSDGVDRPLMDRVQFMEWLILRYVTHATVYDRDEMEAYAAEQVEAARSQWLHEAEDAGDERENALQRAVMEARAARPGWIFLDRIAQHTGVDTDELFRSFVARYTVARAHGDEGWIVAWFDAFDWLQEHYARMWEPDSKDARVAAADLVRRGLSEEAALEKVRRAFINQKASLPISKQVGIRTSGDSAHVLEGYHVIGFDTEGEAISATDAYGWEPYSDLEAEWGFSIRGEGPNY